MIMDYETIIDGIMQNFQHPCDAEIPAGYYRRVIWQGHTENYPVVGVEWATEIIPIGTHLYTSSPFGQKSDPLPVVNSPNVPTNPDGTPGVSTDILVTKIGYYFASQADIDAYIASIGATKLAGNDWYGADLSKANLFKNPGELAMYKVENSGGYLLTSGPRCDQRIRQVYNQTTGAFTSIDYYWNGNRIAYMKHDESPAHQCKYTGMSVNTNADTSIPPVPPALPSTYGALPSEARLFSARSGLGCIPATVGFPYTNISDAMLSAWNETRKTFKLAFDMLTGTIKNGTGIATMFDGLSIGMEEITAGALALSQQAWQTAMKVFRQIISSAFNIVGGAWSLINNFLPTVAILGVAINIYDLVFGDSSVQSLKDSFQALIDSGAQTYESVINAIYGAIGSSYNYTVEYVKAGARDLVDACSALFDWCLTMFQNGCVALVDLYGRMMQIWSMPPETPNPLWSAVLAIRNIMRQIKPLDVILGGNFPGFTAMDLYQQAQSKVKAFIDASYAQISALYDQGQELFNTLKAQTQERDSIKRKFDQYLNWMWEPVTEATTAAYQAALDAANAAVNATKAAYEGIKTQIAALQDGMKDTYSMAMDELKKLPVMAQINQFLGYCGVAFDDLLKTYENALTGAQSLYKNFVDSSRSFKDTCKVIYNQICTLALSKVTQYVNKLLSLIGLAITFGSISVCVPMVQY
ncbi:hypothetical protein [Enterobacter cloacae complex sp. 363J6]|uniref:hypothetical protein n=1 Tax=Enterobacter cloacae complex sp. 363J6 TaxID=3395868 RepID=UPI003CE86CCA